MHYCYERNTYRIIAKREKRSVKWVQKQLDTMKLGTTSHIPGRTILVIDTTYFGNDFGVMVFRCAWRKENLLWEIVKYETNEIYASGIRRLMGEGWIILGIVCDGRPGLARLFPDIPLQICQFHQIQIVTRYITRHPKLPAGVELRRIVLLLTETDEASFTYWLNEWYEKWKEFLAEKSFDRERRQYRFTHRRLRSAYRSLKTHLPHLFIFQKHLALNMPNTTNSLDGSFAHIKEKIGLHRGLKKDRKIKLIQQLLSATSQPQKKFH